MTTRTRHTTRTFTDSGIGADLEQQRRERTVAERLPSRADIAAGVVGIAVVIGVLALAFGATALLVGALWTP